MDELTKVAIGLAEQLRDKVLEELVDLDVRVAQKNHEYRELREQTRQANADANFLMQSRSNRGVLLDSLDGDIRELKRPREGFPDLSDADYEERMSDLRLSIQGAVGL